MAYEAVGDLVQLAPSARRPHSLESSTHQDRTSIAIVPILEEEAWGILL